MSNETKRFTATRERGRIPSRLDYDTKNLRFTKSLERTDTIAVKWDIVFGTPKMRTVLPSAETMRHPAPAGESKKLIHRPSRDHSGSASPTCWRSVMGAASPVLFASIREATPFRYSQ